jgi:flagellar biosynthetic protein FliR
MDLQLFPIDKFQEFLICLARVGGFVSAIPVLFSTQAPMLIKLGTALTLSLVLFPIMAPYIHPAVQFHLSSFFFLVTSEALVGILLGLMSRLIFTAAEFGGTIIGYQMGFAAANVFDPQNQKQISLLSEFQNIFAIFIFLAVDGHHIFIRAAVKSYAILPPGKLDLSHAVVPYLVKLSSQMFALSLQFSAPVLAILLFSGLILGVLARVFPQLNVFLLSFPLNIGISFIVIALTLNIIATLLRREFDSLPERIFTILKLLN